MYSSFISTYLDKIHFIQNRDFIRFINFVAEVDLLTIGELWSELDSKEVKGISNSSIYTLIQHLLEYSEAK